MAKKSRRKDADAEIDPAGGDDFESALAEVERVVEQLESGELGLSESLARYERGIEKIKFCHRVLERAENRISVLTSVDEDGTFEVEPVEIDGAETANPGGRSDPSSGAAGPASGAAAPKRPTESPKTARPRKNRPPVSDMDDSSGLF